MIHKFKTAYTIFLVLAIATGCFVDLVPSWVGHFSLVHRALAVADPSWNTAATDFEIWESSSLTWDAGTLVCGAALTDNNASNAECSSALVKASTTYRVQVVMKNAGTPQPFSMVGGSASFVDFVNVLGGGAGVHNWASIDDPVTAASLGSCAFNDIGANNGATVCSVAANSTTNVRITNTGAGNVIVAAGSSEGFMFTITTASAIPLTDSDFYMNTSVTSGLSTLTEDSSKVTIAAQDYKPSATLYSSAIDMNSYSTIRQKNLLRATWSQDIPTGCAISVYVRGDSVNPLTTAWQGPYSGSGASVSVDLTTMPTILDTSLENKRYYQYYVSLTSCSAGAEIPRLFDLKLDFD